MELHLFTIGYEKRTIKEYIALLKKFNINVLIDVREVAWSYKQDFRKNTLDNFLKRENIQYIHLPEAGNPKEIRKSSENIKECLDNYRLYLSKTESGLKFLKFIILKSTLSQKNVCITCFERDFICCHRSIIIDAIEKNFANLNIVHI